MKFKFGIRTLFVTTFAVGCAMAAVVAYEAYWFIALTGFILTANLLGAVVAIAVTKLFQFPTDGGYRDP